MPVPYNNGPLSSKPAASSRASGLVQRPTRPHRQSIFHNPDWPPAPDHAPPTPSVIRVARARATSNGSNNTGNSHTSASHVHTDSSVPQPDHKLARAEQMQARALAAQAAHQKRFANNMDVVWHQADTVTAAPDILNPVLRSAFNSDGCAPSTNSEDVGDLMEEIQVDLSLMMDATPGLAHIEFTSPSATVDISAFMPPPGPPLLIANDATVAASAVPLSDWAADLTWLLVNRNIDPLSTDYSDWNRQLSSGGVRKEPAPQAFRTFTNATLSATLPSSQCLLLGLLYVSKLPIGRAHSIPPELNNASTPPGVIVLFQNFNFTAWSGLKAVFRKALYGMGMNANGLEASIHVSKLVFTLALMLGNKWLEDNTFTTRTWSDVTSLQQADLKALEMATLNMFGFSMVVRDREWMDWLSTVRSYTSQLVAKEPIGMVVGANPLALGRLDDLVNMGCNHHREVSATPDWTMDSPMQVSVALMNDSCDDEDMVVLPVQTHYHARRGHSRPSSLSVLPAFGPPLAHSTDYTCGVDPHSSFSHHPIDYNPYKRPFNPWARADHADAFQSIAPHPAVVNAGIEARRRAQQPQSVYRWGQVLAEMAAQEREQEDVISGWPRPSRLDWACSSHPVSAIMGV